MGSISMGITSTVIIATATLLSVNNNMKFDNVVSTVLVEQVDVRAIQDIESTGRQFAVSSQGARGVMQVQPETWNEVTQRLGLKWPYKPNVFDKNKNTIVGSYYLNTMIPNYLYSNKIPDSIEARLAAYNWGIGNLTNAYKHAGENWLTMVPQETKDYIEKYNKKTGRIGPTAKIYVVRNGDTLSGIAKKFNMKLSDLLQLNPTIKNPNAISLGQKINIKG